MEDNKTKGNKLIAAYRRESVRRRATSPLNDASGTLVEGVTIQGGTVTVGMAPNSKAVSELGGATKVFGKSKISIPKL